MVLNKFVNTYVTDFYILFEFIIMDFGVISDVINVLNFPMFWKLR